MNDHRTELKVSNVDAVLDGDFDAFIEAYLLMEGGVGKSASENNDGGTT